MIAIACNTNSSFHLGMKKDTTTLKITSNKSTATLTKYLMNLTNKHSSDCQLAAGLGYCK